MPFYTKKPIPIEARQITPENAEELAAWSSSEVIRRPVDGTVTGMMVYTLEGAMTGSVGDYLIKGIRGEFYFCAKDIFEETYEEYVESKGDFHIQVLDFVEQPDGSAIMNFEMGKKALEEFAKIGLLKTLTDEARRVINEYEDIDNNVGC